MTHHEVVKYTLAARWFHWVITITALVLAVTGIFLYVPWFSGLAVDSYSRIIHRVAAVLFVAAPVLFFLARPGRSLHFIKEIFTWGKADLAWLKAAPDYYFGGDESKMPPQPDMNTGQKLWAVVAFFSAAGFILTGLFMWFLKGTLSSEVFLWMTLIHNVCFIVGGAMTLVHLYLGAFHPRMTEALKSMVKGTVSTEYAKSHHGKWYEEVVRHEAGAKQKPGGQQQKQAH